MRYLDINPFHLWILCFILFNHISSLDQTSIVIPLPSLLSLKRTVMNSFVVLLKRWPGTVLHVVTLPLGRLRLKAPLHEHREGLTESFDNMEDTCSSTNKNMRAESMMGQDRLWRRSLGERRPYSQNLTYIASCPHRVPCTTGLQSLSPPTTTRTTAT